LPPTGAKTELDLLMEALQRLDQHYRVHNQQLDHQLNVLAGQLEHLARQVNSLTPLVTNLAAQLARIKDG
jgi:prefoldin subunit 5